MAMYVKHDDSCALLNSSKPKIYEINVQKHVLLQQPTSGREYFVDISEAAELPNDAIVVPESLRNMEVVCYGPTRSVTAQIQRFSLNNVDRPFNNMYSVHGVFVFDKSLYDGRMSTLTGTVRYFKLSEIL